MERSIKGGYILISLGLIALSTEYSGSIDYDRISRTKKRIVLTGIKVGDTVMPDITVKPVYGNGTITFEDVYGYDVVVSSNNSVSVSEHKNLVIVGDITATGKITGGEIVEKMSGYSFEKVNDESIVVDYAGVVKTGNKITFVIAGRYTRPSENPPTNQYLGNFIIPKSIGDKLVFISQPYVDSRNLHFFDSVSSTGIEKAIALDKRAISGDNEHVLLRPLVYGLHITFTAGTSYMFRYEITFLLSENLVNNVI